MEKLNREGRTSSWLLFKTRAVVVVEPVHLDWLKAIQIESSREKSQFRSSRPGRSCNPDRVVQGKATSLIESPREETRFKESSRKELV